MAAGKCGKGLGWGEQTRLMRFLVGDRATFEVRGTRLPVEETLRAAVDEWIAAHLPHLEPGKGPRARSLLLPGSAELRGIFAEQETQIGSNDTCGACGYAPLSLTERLVLDVEDFLNDAAFKTLFPDTGQDVRSSPSGTMASP